MPPPRKTGINSIRIKGRDGSIRYRHYDRKTGAFLSTDRDEAIALAMGHGAVATDQPLSTFGGLCTHYFRSQKFKALAPNSKKMNEFHIGRLRARFGDLPAAAITRPVVIELRDALSERPWYQNHMMKMLRLVLQHGVDLGVLETNPAMRPGGVTPPSRTQVWTEEETSRIIADIRPDLKLAAALMLYTVQRPSDVLAMTWSQVNMIDGRTWITLRQQKTGELVRFPAHRDLETVIHQTKRRGLLMIPSPRGRPWNYRNFNLTWKKEMDRLKIVNGKQIRDLRRTGMVRMAERGATAPQIAALSGHAIERTARILDVYIPRRSEIAAAGVTAWEAGDAQGNVVPMTPPVRRPRR